MLGKSPPSQSEIKIKIKMKQVDVNQVATSDQQIRALGFLPSASQSPREKFQAQGGLEAGTYTPAIEGWQKAVSVPPRGRSVGYDGLLFKNAKGETITIGLSSIVNSIRVVTGMQPAALTSDALWAGEAAMPTANYFRYGALSNMESGRVLEGNEYRAAYLPTPFELAEEVVYVVPRFIEGSNKPIFDEQCHLRKAKCVKDYTSYPDANAQR